MPCEIIVYPGVGLSICHSTVTEHGVSIYAVSKPGEGTTFVVELPVVEPENDCSQA